MAIDGNIYLAGENSLLKFFRGNKEEFNPETSSTPIIFNKVFTDNKMEHIYILDIFNGRVIKFSQDGKIVVQYGNENIKNAKSFFVDEKNKQIYLTTQTNKLISFNKAIKAPYHDKTNLDPLNYRDKINHQVFLEKFNLYSL